MFCLCCVFFCQDSLQEKLNEKMFNYIPVSRGSISSGYSKYFLINKKLLTLLYACTLAPIHRFKKIVSWKHVLGGGGGANQPSLVRGCVATCNSSLPRVEKYMYLMTSEL